MNTSDLKSQLEAAVSACEDKKAENVAILRMDKSSSAFTDYFLISSGANPRQVQAIADEVELRLKREGVYPNNIEGFKRAEWILMDYVDFVIHIFSENARKFYDLERLWKSATRIGMEDLKGKVSRAPRKPVMAADAVRRKTAKPAKSKAVTAIAKAVRAATSRSHSVKGKSTAKAKPATKTQTKSTQTKSKIKPAKRSSSTRTASIKTSSKRASSGKSAVKRKSR